MVRCGANRRHHRQTPRPSCQAHGSDGAGSCSIRDLGEPANGSEYARVDHQIDSVDYQVWYSVDARATKLPESAPRPKKKGGKAVIDFEKDPSVDFLGGDGVEISKKRSDSMRGKVAERA